MLTKLVQLIKIINILLFIVFNFGVKIAINLVTMLISCQKQLPGVTLVFLTKMMLSKVNYRKN